VAIKKLSIEDQNPGKGINLADSGLSQPKRLVAYDYDGLKEDTYFFFGYQFFVIGILYVSPQSVSGWSDEQKQNFSFEKYKENIKHVRWDNDKFYINYVLHPYWGMTYYVRARERGATSLDAYWYSVLLSTMWEFGIEAMFEDPSIQDIFVTPIMGAVIGKYVEKYREGVKSKPVRTGYDNFMLNATDPLGSSNRWVKSLFGKKSSISFSYSLLDDPYKNPLDLNNDEFDYDHRLLTRTNISIKYGLTYKYTF
jgi:hypothetical protein